MNSTRPLPPGPHGLPWVGSLGSMIARPVEFFRSMTLDHGALSHAQVAGQSLYFVNEPSLLEELLFEKQKDLIKNQLTRDLHPLVGQGLLTSEGELWKRQRKLASQPFAPKRLSVYQGPMVEASEHACAAYVDGETCDFHHDIMLLTLRIAASTLLGEHDATRVERVGSLVETALDYFEERIFSWGRLLPARIPTPRKLRFERAKRELDEIVTGIIARCRAAEYAEDNLLARLLRARSDDGHGMSEQLLLDEAVTMLLAGHETTALTLMYAVYLLARHPDIAARLRLELDQHLQGRSIAASDLPDLPYLDGVVREALRLYPPAYAFGRETTKPIELAGYDIAVGAQVIVSPYGMHRNPRYFPEPDTFSPERWSGGAAGELPRLAYLPFGAGHRICIGSHFAQLELNLVLGTLLQRLEFELLDGYELRLSPTVTLRPRQGLKLRVYKRSAGHVPLRTASR